MPHPYRFSECIGSCLTEEEEQDYRMMLLATADKGLEIAAWAVCIPGYILILLAVLLNN